jgi:uncharacterized protein DUF3750
MSLMPRGRALLPQFRRKPFILEFAMRIRLKPVLRLILLLFLAPLAVHAGLYSAEDRAASWSTADWSSAGLLLVANAEREARVLVMAGHAGRWKGIFGVHTWIVIKPADAARWTRYDVVGWGNPVRTNGWAADGRWFGEHPHIVADIRGDAANAAIPKIEAAVKAYPYAKYGDYRVWPGPNSNTFIATLLRAVPELDVAMLPNAIGKDFRDGFFVGLTDSRTGVEANLWGLLGVKLGWVEGIEFNFLSLVAGLDLRHPALKLPGFGRIGFDGATATARTPRRSSRGSVSMRLAVR